MPMSNGTIENDTAQQKTLALSIVNDLLSEEPTFNYTLEDTGIYERQLTLICKARQNGRRAATDALKAIKKREGSELATLLIEQEQKETPVEIPENAINEVEFPQLPKSLIVTSDMTDGLCPLKDEFIRFSMRKSPEGYRDFHASCWWSMLSTINGRRTAIDLEDTQYTPLMVMLAARSTLFAKTVTAEVVRKVLRATGLDWMLGSTIITPQKLLQDMYGPIPEKFDEWEPESQEKKRIQLAMSAQRGWHYHEFGKLLKSMVQSSGYNADFVSVLLQISDCLDELPVSTIGRGDEVIDRPYLSILGTLTPASIANVANKHSELWQDGLFARIAWSCPLPGTYLDSPLKRGNTPVPGNLVAGLREWHERLGVPVVDVVPIYNEKDKPTGRYRKHWYRTLEETRLALSDDAYDGWVQYRSALKKMTASLPTEDFDASYGRLHTMALRVAALATSLAGSDTIQMEHWYLGQEQAEEWRLSLHRLYAQVNSGETGSKEPTLEERIITLIDTLHKKNRKPPTARDIAHRLHMDTYKIEPILSSLVKNQEIERKNGRQSATYQIMEVEEDD